MGPSQRARDCFTRQSEKTEDGLPRWDGSLLLRLATPELARFLLESPPRGGGARLTVDRACGVSKLNLGVGGPLVGTMVEFDRLRDGLRASGEARGRWRHGSEIDKCHALGRIRLPALVLPDAMTRAALSDGK